MMSSSQASIRGYVKSKKKETVQGLSSSVPCTSPAFRTKKLDLPIFNLKRSPFVIYLLAGNTTFKFSLKVYLSFT